MGAIFTSPGRTVGAGVVLLIVIVVVIGAVTGQMTRIDHAWGTFVMRWLHVLSGVLWIGLLWYLNFVQVPTMPSIPAENRVAISKYIAPNVLFYFRYGALATVLTGLLLAFMQGYLVQALMFQKGFIMIGTGMWMALIMAFNVWFIIWPAQQKILGIGNGVNATAEEKAAAAKPALYASRFNTMFSIGMLYCMVAQQNAPI
ncbi:MAG TPA: urate hydroxylase PuuD [Reyranella sp.]|nr:urate hydroxylase PuuD [Reyranella sp.]